MKITSLKYISITALILFVIACSTKKDTWVNRNMNALATKDNILYKCGWSPFEGTTFKSRITHTFVNGQLVYSNSKVKDIHAGDRLTFVR